MNRIARRSLAIAIAGVLALVPLVLLWMGTRGSGADTTSADTAATSDYSATVAAAGAVVATPWDCKLFAGDHVVISKFSYDHMKACGHEDEFKTAADKAAEDWLVKLQAAGGPAGVIPVIRPAVLAWFETGAEDPALENQVIQTALLWAAASRGGAPVYEPPALQPPALQPLEAPDPPPVEYNALPCTSPACLLDQHEQKYGDDPSAPDCMVDCFSVP